MPGAVALERASNELLAFTAYVGDHSHELPIATPDARMTPTIDTGRHLFERRQGELGLSYARCHDENRGKKLADITIPQAHPTGHPRYRLEWQTPGSLQRILGNYLIGRMAEPDTDDSDEYIALEEFLNLRARGMPIEMPAQRP